VKVAIFVEGGANRKGLRVGCRQAFSTLIRNAGVKAPFQVIPCGSKAYDDFCSALRGRGADGVPLLLVDSEGPVKPYHGAWEHLGNRPPGVRDVQAQLMAQCMETWLLTDRPQLRAFYSTGFHENKLPRHTNLEDVHKDEIQKSLKNATEGKYHKGNHSFTLLANLDPEKLKTLPRARQFFEAVEQLPR
jgi:Domain of unknown function (DUF4276)